VAASGRGWPRLPRALGRPGRGPWLVPRDLFGLPKPPEKPHPSYSRLSRYDETGLVWLLQGRDVLALTDSIAGIENSTGNITTYRRHNKPALGPMGDSLDDLQ
jgi:hypothetical protein